MVQGREIWINTKEGRRWAGKVRRRHESVNKIEGIDTVKERQVKITSCHVCCVASYACSVGKPVRTSPQVSLSAVLKRPLSLHHCRESESRMAVCVLLCSPVCVCEWPSEWFYFAITLPFFLLPCLNPLSFPCNLHFLQL